MPLNIPKRNLASEQDRVGYIWKLTLIVMAQQKNIEARNNCT